MGEEREKVRRKGWSAVPVSLVAVGRTFAAARTFLGLRGERFCHRGLVIAFVAHLVSVGAGADADHGTRGTRLNPAAEG